MIELNFVPETLDWCKRHYVPPIEKYVTCEEFGHLDPMDGSCHWCFEMCPYQWEMCSDESTVKSLMISWPFRPAKTRDEAIEFIENYKKRCATEE